MKLKVARANYVKKYRDFGGFMVSGANFFSQFGPMMPKMCQSVSTEHFGKSQSHIGSNSRSRGPIVVKKMVILVELWCLVQTFSANLVLLCKKCVHLCQQNILACHKAILDQIQGRGGQL
jgi:hypothetical protein